MERVTLDTLSRAIDTLVDSDPAAYGDSDSVVLLQKELNRLEAFVTAVTDAFVKTGIWVADGAQTPEAWLVTRALLPKSKARRRVRLGARLPELPRTREAWMAGEIGEAQVDALSAACTEGTRDSFVEAEDLLVLQASTMRLNSFSRVLRYWMHDADPTGSERDVEALRTARDFSAFPIFDGTWHGRFILDPIAGDIVTGEVRRIADELYEADWADTKERLGRDPKPYERSRTPGQLWADALVEMATRSAAVGAGKGRPRPLFTVLVGYETLHGRICELSQGIALTPGSLVPWLTQADIERAVFKSPNRVEVSATNRVFTGATRRSIEVRDRECSHLFCDRPAIWCEVDHVVPFSQGGPTTQENGRLLCGYHNRLRNQRPPPPAA